MIFHVLHWLDTASLFVTPVAISAAFLAIFRRLRPLAGSVIWLCSLFWGIDLWLFSAVTAYLAWGLWPLVVGFMLAGVGVVPIAFFGFLFTKHWETWGNIAVLLVITFGGRFFAVWCGEENQAKRDRRRSLKLLEKEGIATTLELKQWIDATDREIE